MKPAYQIALGLVLLIASSYVLYNVSSDLSALMTLFGLMFFLAGIVQVVRKRFKKNQV